MSDRIVDGAIRRVLARNGGKDQKSGPCPDANELAAYLEARLSESDKLRFEAHAADCPDCREAIALSLEMQEEPIVAAVQDSGGNAFGYRYSTLRIVLGAALAITVGVMLYQATRDQGVMLQPTREEPRDLARDISGGMQARLQSPGQEPEIPASQAGTGVPPPGAANEVPNKTVAEGNAPERSLPPTNVMDATLKAPAAEIASEFAGKPAADKAKELLAEAQQDQPAAAAPEIRAKAKPDESRTAGATVQLAKAPRPLGQSRGDVTGQAQGVSQSNQVQSLSQLNLAQAAAPFEPGAVASMPAIDVVRAALAEAQSTRGQKDEAAASGKKQEGGRLFYRTAHYWVEMESLLHRDAPVRELGADSEEFGELVKKEPGLAGLAAEAVLIFYWNGANTLIR